jgi:G3E family GTPase
MTDAARLELTVVTGFLGSGKTTFVRRMLGQGRHDVAVVVNEFADVGVDQVLIAERCARAVSVVGGCGCCDRLDDVLGALRKILDAHERGHIALRHVLIETSGLADPLPIVTAVAADSVLQHHFRPARVIAVVDGLVGAEHIERHPEVRRQALAADEVVVSKTDLVEPAQVDALRATLAQLGGTSAGAHEHTERVSTVALQIDQPFDWVAFGVWLSLLLHAHGQSLLRIKGAVPSGRAGAVSVNAVHGAMYPPEHIDAQSWPATLVVIAQGLDPSAIRRSLFAFQRAA